MFLNFVYKIIAKIHSQFHVVLYKTLGSMMTFEIWAADCTVLAVQAVAALLSLVKIVRLSYILKSSNLSALITLHFKGKKLEIHQLDLGFP